MGKEEEEEKKWKVKSEEEEEEENNRNKKKQVKKTRTNKRMEETNNGQEDLGVEVREAGEPGIGSDPDTERQLQLAKVKMNNPAQIDDALELLEEVLKTRRTKFKNHARMFQEL